MYGTVYGTSQAYVCCPFHSNCTCTCTNAQGWKTLSEEDGRNKRIAFLPSTNYVTSRHVTSRAINETYDFGQFYYSTRHAKKNMIFLTTNSKPLYIYVYESQQQKSTHTHKHTHTHTHKHQHQICGKNNPISLSKLYNTPCIHTLILYYFSFILIYLSRDINSFILICHPSIHPSIISTPTNTHKNMCIEIGSVGGRGVEYRFIFDKRLRK